MHSSWRSTAKPYLYIVAVLLVVFAILNRFPPIRVGDGSEYYGLYYAWLLTGRPWMTPAAYDAYSALFASHAIVGLVPTEMLASAFEALRVGTTSDFNHFWFYSLLAALCGKAAALVGVNLTPHQSFLALHFLVLTATASIAFRFHAWKGVLAIVLMVAVSPVLWYINKVHTEFLTVCLLLSAVIFFISQRYLLAAFCIALAATQNPSFALIACIPLFYRVVLQRKQAYSLFEVALCVAIVLAVLIHPAYYFARYGVVTPQLLAGGAALGRNLGTFYIWIFDPDLGLLPNWPLGLGVLVLAIGGAVARSRRGASAGALDRRWLAFACIYLVVNFYAHASTTNLNSGATPGLARYALWYLPLGFPLVIYVLDMFPRRTRQWYAGATALVLLGLVSIVVNNPRRTERYTSPSMLSRFLQQRLPTFYNPPWEVFAERYSGFGEEVHGKKVRAILGPDCRKMLVLPGEGFHDATMPGGCAIDGEKLNAYVNSQQFSAASGARIEGTEPRYVFLDPKVLDGFRLRLMPGAHRVGVHGDGAVILGEGWSGREEWGVWSEQRSATLVLPCDDAQYYGPARPFTLSLKLRPFRTQSLVVSSGAGKAWAGAIDAVDQEVRIELPPTSCKDGRYTVTLEMPDAVSPMALGLSADSRLLGVGLSEYEIKLK